MLPMSCRGVRASCSPPGGVLGHLPWPTRRPSARCGHSAACTALQERTTLFLVRERETQAGRVFSQAWQRRASAGVPAAWRWAPGNQAASSLRNDATEGGPAGPSSLVWGEERVTGARLGSWGQSRGHAVGGWCSALCWATGLVTALRGCPGHLPRPPVLGPL